MKKLRSDAAMEKTMFRRDTKAAEKCVVQLFLGEFADGLAVYSGSHHFGYVRLSDKQRIRPADVQSFTSPPKYALFFKIKGCCTSQKTKLSSSRKCTLYLIEHIVMEQVKKSENSEFINRRIDSLFNKVRVCEIRDICPGIMTKLFATYERVCEFTEKVKNKMHIKVFDFYVDANLKDNSLTIHTSLTESEENDIVREIRTLIDQEKEKMMNEVASFEYPKPGSGITLHVFNNGKVKDIPECHGEPAADSKRTLLILEYRPLTNCLLRCSQTSEDR